MSQQKFLETRLGILEAKIQQVSTRVHGCEIRLGLLEQMRNSVTSEIQKLEQGESFDAYWGVGGRIRELDEKEFKDEDDDETKLGVRTPFGARWMATRIPLEIYTELAIVLDIVPEIDVELEGGFGARWFFD